MDGQTRSHRHTHGNIHDVYASGYAETETSRTSTSYLRLSQGAAKTEVIL